MEVEHYCNDYFELDYCKEVDSKRKEEVEGVDLCDPYLEGSSVYTENSRGISETILLCVGGGGGG